MCLFILFFCPSIDSFFVCGLSCRDTGFYQRGVWLLRLCDKFSRDGGTGQNQYPGGPWAVHQNRTLHLRQGRGGQYQHATRAVQWPELSVPQGEAQDVLYSGKKKINRTWWDWEKYTVKHLKRRATDEHLVYSYIHQNMISSIPLTPVTPELCPHGDPAAS